MKYLINGNWKFYVDEKNDGIERKIFSLAWLSENYDNLENVEVPSNYNTKEGLDKYAGTVWYFITLPEIPIQPKSYEYHIEFDGVNYITEAWINDTYLGKHEGGFLPFRLQFNPRIFSLKVENYLAIRVDASYSKSGVPSNNTDWFNWGGIYRDIGLIIVPKIRIKDVKITTMIPTKKARKAIISIDYKIKRTYTYLEQCYIRQTAPQIEYQLFYLGRLFAGMEQFNQVLLQTGTQDVNPETQNLNKIPHDQETIEAYFQQTLEKIDDNRDQSDLESFFLKEKRFKTENNKAEKKVKERVIKKIGEEDSDDITNTILITLNNPSLWSPENPDLYLLKINLNNGEEGKQIRFGIRQIYIRGTNIFINHNLIKLKGANLHEELMPYGRNYPLEERRADIIEMKALGFNAIRTAHYSHDQSLIRLADEEGMYIFEEIPLYWDCDFKNNHTIRVAAAMVRDLIKRDINNPSVIAWSVGNEIPTERIDCKRTISLLMNLARRYDDSRMVFYVSNRYMGDTLRRDSDFCGQNEYFGWYFGSVYMLNFIMDVLYQTSPNKPWIITEFGAGAKHGIMDPNIKFSETNQARIISHTIKVLNSKPYVSGWFIWLYRDFRSHLRTNKYQLGYNRKGLVSEKNEKKLIARVMKQIINDKIEDIKHYRGSAHMLSLLLRWFERFFFAIFAPIGYKIQRKMNSNYYWSKRIN